MFGRSVEIFHKNNFIMSLVQHNFIHQNTGHRKAEASGPHSVLPTIGHVLERRFVSTLKIGTGTSPFCGTNLSGGWKISPRRSHGNLNLPGLTYIKLLIIT